MPTFPTEILARIFKEVTSVDTILTLQQVSKQFNDITRDPSFLKSLYATAPLPRPPGPFEWQSPQYLLRKLAQSDRVASAWTKSKFSGLSLHGDSPIMKPFPVGYWYIVGTRWLFWASDNGSTLACINLKTGLKQLLREESEPSSYSTAGSISANGEILYHLTITRRNKHGKLDMYQVEEHSGSLTLIESFEIPSNCVPLGGTPHIYVEGHLVSLSTETQILVFDSQSRVFYTFTDALPGTEELWHDRHERPRYPIMPVILAKTHVLVYSHWVYGDTRHDRGAMIHAFELAAATPTEDDWVRELHVTHRESVGGRPGPVCLLFEPFVHPTEGYTRIGFLNCQYEEDEDSNHPTQLTYVDLMLDPTNPESFNKDVDPDESDYFGRIEVKERTLLYLKCRAHSTYVQSSDDGHVRGICLAGEFWYTEQVYKFSIDLMGGFDDFPREAVVRAKPALSNLGFFKLRVDGFDAVTGQALIAKYEKDVKEGELWLADIL